VKDLQDFATALGFAVRGVERSPVLGPKGNVEFLMWLGGEAG
jgi:predicted rRNA methylase YqxC with S4 and FtsJ domains